jgi:hypothetical protein
MTCLSDTRKDLFVEELVDLTGAEELIPDLLWGATSEDLIGLNPLAVYFYEWREAKPEELPHLTPERLLPYIDMGILGKFVGVRRETETIEVTRLVEAIAKLS